MQNTGFARESAEPLESRVARMLHGRTLVMVGMMGAGKSSVGRRLASRLAMPFVDADTEIELAANSTIPEIFDKHGETYFRDGERRVGGRRDALRPPERIGAVALVPAEPPVGHRRRHVRAMSLPIQAAQDIVETHASADLFAQAVDGLGPLLDAVEVHRARTRRVRVGTIHGENL